MGDADPTVQLGLTVGMGEACWTPGHGELVLFSAASALRCSGRFYFSAPFQPHVLFKNTSSFTKPSCICISGGVFYPWSPVRVFRVRISGPMV